MAFIRPTRIPRIQLLLVLLVSLLALSVFMTPLLGAEDRAWGPGGNSVDSGSGQTTTAGTVPTATSTPTPTPTNTPVPTVTPANAQTIVAAADVTPVSLPPSPPGVPAVPLSVVVVQPNETAIVTSSVASAVQVTIRVPVQVFDTTRQMTVSDTSSSQLALIALPSSVREVRSSFVLSVYDAQGTKLDRPTLNRCITLTMPYTADDVAAADGDANSLKIMRYDDLMEEWILQTTTVHYLTQEISAQVCGTLSIFGIGVALTAAPTATAVPATVTPILAATGDITPPSILLVVLLAAGVVLVMSGIYYLRQSRT